jgi:biotin-dependent carboxylase-like uncharacterized protein
VTVAFQVLEPGSLSTIQDAGRPDAAPLGVPRSGACDPWSLAIANLLVGNDAGAAALEVTHTGPELLVVGAGTIAIAGAELCAVDRDDDRALPSGGSYRLRAGTTLGFETALPGEGAPGDVGGSRGARAYLAVPGGFDVPVVLGSRSTCLVGAFGGVDGRPIRAGDRLVAASTANEPEAGVVWPGPPAMPDDAAAPVRVVRGPHHDLLGGAALERLLATTWTVSPDSDRMGLRLERDPARASAADPAAEEPAAADGIADTTSRGEIVSLPVVWGSVQLPPGGRPIVLLADHQTVGGYPVVACVIGADLPRVGQLAASARVRFALTDLPTARAARRAQLRALHDGAAAIRRGDAWERLVAGAAG